MATTVAITDELTTLLDWVCVESFSGLTIIVENVGGGSANDIADVQVDTSDDGGVTVSLDQHAGEPAVPIADGKASIGEFTETAAFIRVRAVCATDEDTTARAWLLADSNANRICTLDDVKTRLGLTTTDNDIIINRIITGLESVFDNYTKRHLIQTAAAQTEYYCTKGNYLQLDRYPIISITSVKEAYDYDFSAVTALVADTDYRLLRAGVKGILHRLYCNWPGVEDAVQVIYRGGYCPAGQVPGTSEIALPDDLREAAIEQASYFFKRKDDIGLSSVSMLGGSISKFAAMELLPMVRQILDKYVKPQL